MKKKEMTIYKLHVCPIEKTCFRFDHILIETEKEFQKLKEKIQSLRPFTCKDTLTYHDGEHYVILKTIDDVKCMYAHHQNDSIIHLYIK